MLQSLIEWLYCSKDSIRRVWKASGGPGVQCFAMYIRKKECIEVDYGKDIEFIYTHKSLARMDAKKVWRTIEGMLM